MEMKRTILSFSFVLTAMLAHAQLTLEGCQHSAQTIIRWCGNTV